MLTDFQRWETEQSLAAVRLLIRRKRASARAKATVSALTVKARYYAFTGNPGQWKREWGKTFSRSPGGLCKVIDERFLASDLKSGLFVPVYA